MGAEGYVGGGNRIGADIGIGIGIGTGIGIGIGVGMTGIAIKGARGGIGTGKLRGVGIVTIRGA